MRPAGYLQFASGDGELTIVRRGRSSYAFSMQSVRKVTALVGAALAVLPVGGCRQADPIPEAANSAIPSASKSTIGSGSGNYAARSANSGPGVAASTAGSPTADVISSASPVWSGSPAKVLSDTGIIDGNALRARNLARLRSDRSPVTVLDGGGPLSLGERLCEQVVPKRPAATKVLIKPNLGGFDWFKDPAKSGGDDGVKGRITDPRFVQGIIKCLKKRGHTAITIAEGWGAKHEDWERLIEVSGYAAMAKDEHVRLVAMDDDGVFDDPAVHADTPGKPLKIKGLESTHIPTLLVPKILAEHLQNGLFISAPKLKAHRFAVMSVGLKGAQGTVMLSDASPAFRQKWRMHKELNPWLTARKTHTDKLEDYVRALELFAERMTEVMEVELPDAVLVDASPGNGGDGFQKLLPVVEDAAFGGTNVVLVDRIGAELLGLFGNKQLAAELGGHETSPLLTTAAKRFGIAIDKRPEIAGDVALFAKPRAPFFVSMAGFTLGDSVPKVVPGALDDRPNVVAASLGKDTIVLDGVASEAAWSRAAKTTWTTDWSGKESGTRTTARFLWSKDALYAHFELEGADLHVNAGKPKDRDREKLYEEDCVELFLGFDPTKTHRYAEIEVGPLGHYLDLLVDRDEKKSDVAWSSGLTVGTATVPGERRANIEIALKAPEIVAALREGVRLPLGLYRMEGKDPRQYLAWSPTRTKKPNFHVPERFGWLSLSK